MNLNPPDPPVDRFFKQKLQQELLSVVYDTWEAHLAERMDVLIEDNARITGNTDPCLRLRGRCRWHTKAGAQVDQDYYPTNKLHPSLQPVAHAWLNDYTEIETEKRIVTYSLASALSISDHLADYLEMLPEGLHLTVQQFNAVLPDQAAANRAPPAVVAYMKARQAPHLALMGQRYVRSLIL